MKNIKNNCQFVPMAVMSVEEEKREKKEKRIIVLQPTKQQWVDI